MAATRWRDGRFFGEHSVSRLEFTREATNLRKTPNSLTDAEVQKVQRLRFEEGLTRRVLCERFDVSKPVINKAIRKGKEV